MKQRIKGMAVRQLVGVLRTCDAGDEFKGVGRADVFEAVLQELERRCGPDTDREVATRIVAAMNGVLQAAPEAVTALCEHRVPSNRALGDHPTCQVGPGPEFMVGLLGVLNAIAGVQPSGWGYVAAVFDEGRVVEFVVIPDGGPVLADGGGE